jgi:hypothetical protein
VLAITFSLLMLAGGNRVQLVGGRVALAVGAALYLAKNGWTVPKPT